MDSGKALHSILPQILWVSDMNKPPLTYQALYLSIPNSLFQKQCHWQVKTTTRASDGSSDNHWIQSVKKSKTTNRQQINAIRSPKRRDCIKGHKTTKCVKLFFFFKPITKITASISASSSKSQTWKDLVVAMMLNHNMDDVFGKVVHTGRNYDLQAPVFLI